MDCPWWGCLEALKRARVGDFASEPALMLKSSDRIVLLQHDGLDSLTGKTGLAMLRHREVRSWPSGSCPCRQLAAGHHRNRTGCSRGGIPEQALP